MKQNSKILILLILLAGLSFAQIRFFAPRVLAQTPATQVKCADGSQPVNNKCPINNPAPGYLVDRSDFGKLLQDIIQIILIFAGAIAVIFLMVGGFQYITARGNEEGMEKAKKTITGAIIGIVIIVMSFAIIAIINTILTKTPAEQNQAPATTPTPTPSPGPAFPF